MNLRRFAPILPIFLLFLTGTRAAFAHAILVRSTPADHAIVHKHDVQIALEYNSRIDAARSLLKLSDAAGNNIPVKIQPAKAVQTLRAIAGNLANGIYHIHWQVLASDGHITRGDLAFTVDAK